MTNNEAQVGHFALSRKGSELRGLGRKWNMLSVSGPLEVPAGDGTREYFRIETSSAETLVVYRGTGTKGMRELYLFAMTKKSA